MYIYIVYRYIHIYPYIIYIYAELVGFIFSIVDKYLSCYICVDIISLSGKSCVMLRVEKRI